VILADGLPIHRPAPETHVAPSQSQSRPPLEARERHGYALHYGNARSPLVRVTPDANWLGMWRMIWPDGSKSDIANLSRIKDAAAAICERGPPGRNRRRFHWKIDRGA
jgi:hypothetical protein